MGLSRPFSITSLSYFSLLSGFVFIFFPFLFSFLLSSDHYSYYLQCEPLNVSYMYTWATHYILLIPLTYSANGLWRSDKVILSKIFKFTKTTAKKRNLLDSCVWKAARKKGKKERHSERERVNE